MTMNNRPSQNDLNTNNYVQVQLQNSVSRASTEIQITARQTFINALHVKAQMNYQQNNPAQQTEGAGAFDNVELCIRGGCNKRAVEDTEWNNEYCSNECAVMHCRDVFSAWVQENGKTTELQQ